MSAVLRRIRAFGGHLGLLAALALVAALLVAGVPRVANHYTDQGLRSDLSRLSYLNRDIVFGSGYDASDKSLPSGGDALLPSYEHDLPDPLPALVEDRWYTADSEVPGQNLSGPAPYTGVCRPSLRVRYQSGEAGAVRVVEGAAPVSDTTTVRAMVSRADAKQLGLKVGTKLTAAGTTTVLISGLFEPLDDDAPYWDTQRVERIGCPQADDGMTWQGTVLTDLEGSRLAVKQTELFEGRWRYRLDVDRITAPGLDALTTAVVDARRNPPQGRTLRSNAEPALLAFAKAQSGAQATVAVVESGLIATVLGLILLAALLMVERRRAEYALLRARGAIAGTVALRTLAETVLVVAPTVLLGWLFCALLPGRAAGSEPALIAALLLLAVGVAPLLAALVGGTGGRRPGRPGSRRLAGEVFVLLLAGLGVVLVRQRGVQDGVDPFLSVVPVLLGAAAALAVVRLLPWPLRKAGRLAARARGLVAFLGLARAGRGTPLSAGPVAVLIVAAATGVFTVAVNSTISDARDRATDRAVGADAQVTGFGFAAGTDRLLTQVPGVDAAVPLLAGSGAQLTATSGRRAQAQLVIIDGAAANDLLRRSGVTARMPGPLASATTSGPIQAVVSPDVAADIGAGGSVSVQGRSYEFRVAETTAEIPGLGTGTRRFIALPWRSVPAPDFQPLVPTRYLLAGHDFDNDAVRKAADAGQREYYLALLRRTIDAGITQVTDQQLPRLAEIITWEQHRQELEDSGVNALLTFVFLAGAVGSIVLALLAVGLAVLADAPGRGQALSRLRTLGLSGRQGRNLLILELTPLLAVAFLAGTAVGWLLPRLIGPALGLDAFTAGVAPRVAVDPWLAVQALALLLAGLSTAVLVETAAHRRMGLGASLRLGEDI